MTRVLFRKFDDGVVIALFPDIEADIKGNIQSYMHIGQHGAASPDLIHELDSANAYESAPLAQELSSAIGYDKLDIINDCHSYEVFVVAHDNSQWGEGWQVTVFARDETEAKQLAKENVRRAIEQPKVNLIAEVRE